MRTHEDFTKKCCQDKCVMSLTANEKLDSTHPIILDKISNQAALKQESSRSEPKVFLSPYLCFLTAIKGEILKTLNGDLWPFMTSAFWAKNIKQL